MFIEALLGLTLFFLVYYFDRKPRNLPPGEWGWPIFGSLPSAAVPIVDQIQERCKKYGDIFTWRIAGQTNIFLCDYNMIKTTLNKAEVSGRPPIYSLDVFTNFVKLGISTSTGKVWQENRRFAIHHLQKLGMGKTSYESVIQEEVICVIKDVGKGIGGPPKPIPMSLNLAVLNVIWGITADRRYDVEDQDLQRFHDLITKLFSDVKPLVTLYDLIPGLHKVVPKVVERWCGVDDFLAIYKEMTDFFMIIIKEHQSSLDPENPRDYIDHYLIEMDAQAHNKDSHLSIQDLTMNLADLFVAGSETTTSTIRWAIFYLAKFPRIQNRVQRDIDSVVDRQVLPSLEHRDSLPYLEAVIREVKRNISLVALALPHYTHQETTIHGYCIPKNTIVIPGLEKCHTDPAYWDKPDEFYPEHFLDAEGKLNTRKEGYLPFSTGKRICPGAALSYMELFLFISGLLQNYTFILPEGEDLNPKRNPKDRMINTCKQFNVIVQRRQ